MNPDMIKSFVSTVVVFALGFIAVKAGLDTATIAGIGAAAGALVVAVWKMMQHTV